MSITWLAVKQKIPETVKGRCKMNVFCKLSCKIFRSTDPSEKQINNFLGEVDVFSIHVVVEQAYKLNVDEQSVPVHFVYVFYKQHPKER